MRRHIALLSGTTSFKDVLTALSKLIIPYNLINGSSILKYEELFARKVGTKYAVSFSSGRVGLFGLLKSFGIGAGDEVLLQVPTHIVVANAIKYTGATPVYLDCNLNDFNVDLDKAISRITKNTKAIVLQHTFGIPADIDGVKHIADEHGLIIIEDCVHALGAKYSHKNVGSFGDASFFSTEETKITSTTMGGMVTTDDTTIAKKMKIFQEESAAPDFWLTYKYLLKFALYYFLLHPNIHRYTRAIYEFLGKWSPLPKPTTPEEWVGKIPEKYEQRLSNSQAIIGLRQLNKLEENLNHRRMIAKKYQELFESRGIETVKISPNTEPSYVRYPVLVKDREEAVRRYKRYGVLGIWFNSVLSESVSPSYGNYINASCPNAEFASKHLVNLLTHPKVTTKDAEKAFSIIEDLVLNPDEKKF